MNKTIFETNVSFYKSVHEATGETRLLSSLLLSKKWRAQVEAVRNEADPERRKKLKQALPAFTVSGVFNGRKELQAHSGFMCIDIDAKDNENVKDFAELKNLIAKLSCVAYCGLSVSGAGYFCIIPIKDPDKHGKYFRSLQYNFKRCGITIDGQCGNINRMRFASFDPSPYVNTGATVYDYVLPVRKVESRKAGAVDDDEVKHICEVLEELEENRTDITGNYGQWFEILCSIAATFGEDGREYAHRVSRQAESYTFEETESKYTDILKHGGYGYSIGTFYHYAGQYSAKMDFKDFMKGGEV